MLHIRVKCIYVLFGLLPTNNLNFVSGQNAAQPEFSFGSAMFMDPTEGFNFGDPFGAGLNTGSGMNFGEPLGIANQGSGMNFGEPLGIANQGSGMNFGEPLGPDPNQVNDPFFGEPLGIAQGGEMGPTSVHGSNMSHPVEHTGTEHSHILPAHGPNSHTGSGSGMNFGEPLGMDPSHGTGMNFGESLGMDPNLGSNMNFGEPLGMDPNHGTGMNIGEPLGSGLNFGEPLGLDPNHGTGMNFGEPLGPNHGSGLNFGEPLGINPNQGSGMNFGEPLGIDPNQGSGMNFGEPLGIDPNQGLGMNFGEPLGIDPNQGSGMNFGEPLGIDPNQAQGHHGSGIVPGHTVSIHSDPPGVHGNTEKHAVDHLVTGQADIFPGHGHSMQGDHSFGEPLGIVPGHTVSIHSDPPGVHGNTEKHAVDHLVTGQADIFPGHGHSMQGDHSFGEPLGIVPGHTVSIHSDPPGVHGNTEKHAVDHLVTGQTDILPGHSINVQTDHSFGEPLGIVPGHTVSIHSDPSRVHGNTEKHAVDRLVTGQKDILQGQGHVMQTDHSFRKPLGIPEHTVSIHSDTPGVHGNTEKHAVDLLVTGQTDILPGHGQDIHTDHFGTNVVDIAGKHKDLTVDKHLQSVQSVLPKEEVSIPKQISGENYMSRLGSKIKSKSVDAVKQKISPFTDVHDVPNHGVDVHTSSDFGEPLGMVPLLGSHKDPSEIGGHLGNNVVDHIIPGQTHVVETVGKHGEPFASGVMPKTVMGVPDLDQIAPIILGKTPKDKNIKLRKSKGMTIEEKVSNAENVLSSLMYPGKRNVKINKLGKTNQKGIDLPYTDGKASPFGMLDDAMSDVRRMSRGIGSLIRSELNNPLNGQTVQDKRVSGHGSGHGSIQRGYPANGVRLPGFGRTMEINPNNRGINQNQRGRQFSPMISPNRLMGSRYRSRGGREENRRGGRRSTRRQNRQYRRNRRRRVRSRWNGGNMQRNLQRVATRLMG